MSNLNMLKRQHRDVLTIINNIETLIMNDNLAVYAKDISYNLNILAGKLKMHLISEDKFLYPQLMNSNKEDVWNIAHAFNYEMGSVSESFASFVQRYNVPDKILNNKEGFIAESKIIFDIIKNRIDKEDHKLYPLIEN